MWLRNRSLVEIVKNLLGNFLSVRDIKRILVDKLSKERWFDFNSNKLEYFFHSYNNFRLTERSIEIPIVKYFLDQADYQNVLEIGNVTNHYYGYFREVFKRKTIVDKFELAYDVINIDICEYIPDDKFDFIFSISTFEHMDSDRGENPSYVKGNSKLLSYAADNIKYVLDVLLADGGKFLLTVPLGYETELDESLYSGELEKCNFARYKMFVFRKETDLIWKQVGLPQRGKAIYNSPLPGTNYLVVIEFDK